MLPLITLQDDPNKSFGAQYGETVYILEVNEARKVKPDVHVAMNNKSDHMQIFFLRGGWAGYCPQLNFFQTSRIV